MRVLAIDLRRVARLVDDASKEGSTEAQEAAIVQIREAFTVMVRDQSAQAVSKRLGLMFVINQLLALSFRTNNYSTATPIIKTLEERYAEYKALSPLADRVTYSYYLGRRDLFASQYAQADTNLSFALQHCHKASELNKRLILIYLVPVKLLRGQLPSSEMLRAHGLPEFIDIAEAIRTGNLEVFTRALDAHQMFFIKWGIYLVIESLRMIVYRTLFKKVYVWIAR